MKRKITKIVIAFLVAIFFNALPASALTLNMQQLSQKLPFLNQPFDKLPSVSCGEALKNLCQPGQIQLKPADYLHIGDLGLGRTNLAGMANATGVDLNKISVGNLKGVLSNVKVVDLVKNQLSKDPRFNYLDKNLSQVPLLADINKQLGLNLPDTTKISDAITKSVFSNASLSNISSQASQKAIGNAIPNFSQMPFSAVPAISAASIGSFGGGFNLSQLRMNQIPAFSGGVPLPLDLARLNYTATAERVVNANRNACGGIPQPSFQVKAQACTGTCKGFELLSAVGKISSLNGSMCVEHQVPDGHGPLAAISGGQGKSGNFPVGRELALHLTNINNRDQALLTGNFQTCLYLPFVPDPWTCTAHILPLPDGVPLMNVSRNQTLPFHAPSTLAALPQSSGTNEIVDREREIIFANWGLFYRSDNSRGA